MPPILQNIANKWFLFEPALFAILFSHRLTANEQMLVPFRVGQMRVEYNPLLLAQMDTCEEEVEALLKYEMFRILLGHPYMRQPDEAQKEVLTLASNCVMGDNYAVGDRLFCPINHRNLCFEEYYALLREEYSKPNGKGEDEEKSPQDYQPTEDDATSNGEDTGKGSDDESAGEDGQDKNEGTSENESQDADGGQNSQAQPSSEQLASQSELWEEDALNQEIMREYVGEIVELDMWGTMPGGMVELIKSGLVVKIDYRRILSMFRASVLGSKRRLTRMLPSRRYGFEYMGSKRDMTCNLLVAVDVSGSVSTRQAELALAAINRTFKCGIESIDVVTFDTEVYDKSLVTLKKATKQIEVHGRGGTDFQPVVDYFHKARKYDGLLLITDGYACKPTLPQYFSGHILWMLYNESAYKSPNRHTLNSDLDWIASFPRSRYLIMPPAKR